MSVGIDDDAVINNIIFTDQSSAPATPGAGKTRIFTKADGLYIIDDDGDVIGPFITGTTASASYPTFSGAILLKSSTQNVPPGTGTAVTFDGELIDTDSYHNTGTATTRLTAPATGYYMTGGSAELNSLGDQKSYILRIRKNNADADGDGRTRDWSSGAASLNNPHFSRIVQLSAGEYIELIVEHNSVATIPIRETSNGTSFWIYRVA